MSIRRTSLATRLYVLPFAALLAAAAEAQESVSPFDAPVVIATGQDRITDLLDLDADGSIDAVGWFADRVSGWRNDGSGTFARVFSFELELETGLPVRQMRTGRLDADSLDDFAFCHGRRIVAYRSNGAAAPALLFDHLGVAEVSDFALADFNGDGLDDIVAILEPAFERTLTLKVYRNAGAGRLVLTDERTMPSLYGPVGLFVAEMNGDGLPDFGFFEGPDLFLFPLGGRGLPEPIVLPRQIAVPMTAGGDVDGDGDEDVVIFGPAEGTHVVSYQILRRTGPETLVPEPPVPGGPATKLADVDGDGDLDGVCCGGGGGSNPWNDAPSVFEISINDGTGAFAPATRMPGLGALRIAGAADVDHDGDVDLVGGRCVYYSQGPLRAFDRPSIPFLGPIPEMPAPLVDADADGDLDAGFALGGMCANRGDGTFATRVLRVLDPPAGLALLGPGIAGDFDGDGDADLLVEARDDSGAFVETRLLRNAGCGDFVDGGPAAPPGPRLVEMADLAFDPSLAVALDADGDGDLDVVAQNRIGAPFRIRVWSNDGTGSFSISQIFVDEGLKGAADMNGDGLVDLVVQTPDAPFAGIRNGRSDGGFDPISSRLTGLRLDHAFTLADFDDDGDVDVFAVSTAAARRFVILENDGAEGFAPTEPFGFDTAPQEPTRKPFVVPCDWNGDERLDVVLRAQNGGVHPVSALFARTEEGLVYEPAVRQVFWAARAADVDGDGDHDLIQAPSETRFPDEAVRNADRVIRNRRISPPAAGVRRQYGEGTPGASGLVPILGVAGDLRPGVRPEYRLSGGLGGSRAVLLIGTETRNDAVRGGTLLVDPRWRRKLWLDGDAATPGAGSFHFVSKPIAPSHAGLTLHYQAVIRDPEAPEGFSFSNGLSITFGAER